MPRRDAIVELQRASSRRADAGTTDIALGLLLFTLGAGLDLGHLSIGMAMGIPLIFTAIQMHLVWPRAGYALAPRRVLAEAALLFGLSFLALLALVATIGVGGPTGVASGSGRAAWVRLMTAAAILALPVLLAWVAQHRALPRYYAYAVAIPATFAVGIALGLEARAWALALFSLAVVGAGAHRLRRFLAANPRIAGGNEFAG